MKTKRTPLTPIQILRLMDMLRIDQVIVSADLVEVVVNGYIRRIEIKYEDHEESVYAPDEDMDYILNGIKLERNEK